MGISTFGGSDLSVGKYPDLYLPNKGYIAGNYYAPTVGGRFTTDSYTTQLNEIHFSPFLCARTHTFTGITLGNQSAAESGNTFRLGIYNDDNGRPSTLVLDAGEVTLDATAALREIAISQQLEGGKRYWLASFFGAISAIYYLSYVSGSINYGFPVQGETPDVGRPVGQTSIGLNFPKITGFTYGAMPADVSTGTLSMLQFGPYIQLKG
jgi:hypothetical protein